MRSAIDRCKTTELHQAQAQSAAAGASATLGTKSTIASEIVNLKRQLRHRKEALVHVDATLRLLDPSIDTETIRHKRVPRHVKLFRQGELGRLILDTIRRARA